ncbi:LysM peptidoglycan-binding domain-containing protein [Solibacillus sp. A46]|uniref:LysM peptidoglycan-binding domain-containing protein n=1 Tax=Solibacillus faecavium TaxID=2762221 RepID=A0ABR8XZJ5_9BACL|nr:M14 family metallopeptidase [Solibacillus faecavium]MBD8037369.1 LysM peptidoglycan-binding domain-containing protein [Solibacillus faecavium]
MEIFVRPGDSFWYYSQVFNLPYQLIIDSNRNLNAQALIPNQPVQIPGYVTNPYTVQPGDSVWSIAQRINLPMDAIFLVNPRISPYVIQVGTQLLLPVRVTWLVVNGKQNYDYSTMVQDIRTLQAIYPFLVNEPIGNSVLEKEIPGLTIGKGQKRVHFNASFHANEWITTPIVMTFLNEYLLSLTNNGSIRGLYTLPLYNQTSLNIVPMVNPDGVDLVLNGLPEDATIRNNLIEWNGGSTDFSGWKANINGVDLNDQFPAEWELERERNPKTPGPRDYGGESPLSQPESIAMAELTVERDFARVLAFHTQGQVIFWGFMGLEPPETEQLVNEFSRVSGYEPIQTIESYAGYKDWFIQDWRRPGFTVELGLGTNPLPISQFGEIYEEALGIFLSALYM